MQVADGKPTHVAVPGLESVDPSKLWLLGLVIEPDGSLAGPGLRRFSFLEECECPGHCNIDHDRD